jgi:hypothetical protein
MITMNAIGGIALVTNGLPLVPVDMGSLVVLA